MGFDQFSHEPEASRHIRVSVESRCQGRISGTRLRTRNLNVYLPAHRDVNYCSFSPSTDKKLSHLLRCPYSRRETDDLKIMHGRPPQSLEGEGELAATLVFG